MNIKRHSLRVLAALVFAALSTSPLTHAAPGDAAKPLMIQEQGSFAVGGTVIQSPGTFDTSNPSSGGQTLHGTTPASSTRCRSMPENYRW
jgi:hypothetical protein